jgi:hypothetical protein
MVRFREGGGQTVAQEVLSLEKVAARMDRHASEVALREAAAV